MSKIKLSITMDEALASELDRIGEQQGRNRSEVIQHFCWVGLQAEKPASGSVEFFSLRGPIGECISAVQVLNIDEPWRRVELVIRADAEDYAAWRREKLQRSARGKGGSKNG